MHVFNPNQGPLNSLFHNFNKVAKPVIKNVGLISGVALFVLGCLAMGGVVGNITFAGCAIALGTVTLIGIGKSLHDSRNLNSVNKMLLACFECNLIASGALAMISLFTPISLITTSILVGIAGSMLYTQ